MQTPLPLASKPKAKWLYSLQIGGSVVFGALQGFILNIYDILSGNREKNTVDNTYPYASDLLKYSSYFLISTTPLLYLLGGLLVYGSLNLSLTRYLILMKRRKKYFYLHILFHFTLFVVTSLLFLFAFIFVRAPVAAVPVVPAGVKYSVYASKSQKNEILRVQKS